MTRKPKAPARSRPKAKTKAHAAKSAATSPEPEKTLAEMMEERAQEFRQIQEQQQ